MKKYCCPNCGRYRAHKKGFFRKRLICSYCQAISVYTGTTPIKEGWLFRRTIGYEDHYNVKGGSDWKNKWRKLRKSALKHSGNKCSNCSSSEHLEVHHIKPVSKGGKDELSNLKVLCRRCHKISHKKRWFWFW